MKRLRGRVAAVTGAASGIGRALSLALASRGMRLALIDLNGEGLETLAAEARAQGCRVSTHTADVRDKARMSELPKEVIEEHGAVHLLVNNAGVAMISSFEQMSLEDWEWIVGINLWGVIYGCKFFLPYLKSAEEAHIVNISSLAGYTPLPTMSGYCATKFAVRGLSESLRQELAGENIGVTCVHPGAVATNIPKAARYRVGAPDDRVRTSGMKALERIGRSPEQAAREIVAGIERNKARVLIGPDARVLDLLKRMAPGTVDSTFGLLWSRFGR